MNGKFSEQLNTFIEDFQITSQDLAMQSGLSKATISRFRTGKKEPNADSTSLVQLIQALARLSKDSLWDEEHIRQALLECLPPAPQDFSTVAANLNQAIETMRINVHELSQHLNYDPSYLSRIRSGQRKPGDMNKFCSLTAEFLCREAAKNPQPLLTLIGMDTKEIPPEQDLKSSVLAWLAQNTPAQIDPMTHFLEQISSFDLNEYMRGVHAAQSAEDAVPALDPAAFGNINRTYTAIDGFQEAELFWMQSALASPDHEPLLFYSDMPIQPMNESPDFARQFVAALMLLLKKGHRIQIIHNVNRSFEEMLLGLEHWIPLYMTGLVAPYYIKGTQNQVFHHFLRTSNRTALCGEAIQGYYGDGRYTFTSIPEEAAYYRKRGQQLLNRASSLMTIYRMDQAEAYNTWLQQEYEKPSDTWSGLYSAPPLYTLSDELLESILSHNDLSPQQALQIRSIANLSRNTALNQLENGNIQDSLSVLSPEEFQQYPASLMLADLFWEKAVYYTYEEYVAHIQQSQAFAGHHQGYSFRCLVSGPFSGIQVRLIPGRTAIVSRNKAPAVHFVIQHPKLRTAIEQMIQTL